MRALLADLLRSRSSFAWFRINHAAPVWDGGERMVNPPQGGMLLYEEITFVPRALPEHKRVMP